MDRDLEGDVSGLFGGIPTFQGYSQINRITTSGNRYPKPVPSYTTPEHRPEYAENIPRFIIYLISTRNQVCFKGIHSFINGSTALCWALASFVISFTQSVGLLGRVIRPSQGRYLHTQDNTNSINAYIDIPASSGIRTHEPSISASEDSSCLRPRDHRDRLF
jgi:hypothetical protein